MARRRGKVKGFRDSCVIYWSRDDEAWVAHSLRTDQIGVGGGLADALADLMRAVGQVLAVANEDPTVEIFRDAPASVQRMAKTAMKLPDEVYDVAHRMVHGTWPDDVTADFGSKRSSRKFTASIHEEQLATA